MAEKKTATKNQQPKALKHDCFKCENHLMYETDAGRRVDWGCTVMQGKPAGIVVECTHFDAK